jgi:hypothetical protein
MISPALSKLVGGDRKVEVLTVNVKSSDAHQPAGAVKQSPAG